MVRKTDESTIDRRRFLQRTWTGVGASLSLALLPGHELFATGRFGDNPFTLGVASGDPTSDGIVLWTRLAPEPAVPGSLGQRTIPVRWRVATDSRMRHVIARGVATAPPQLAHSVHVEVEGLRPRHDYFYQFDVRGEESAIGHFRTAPAAHELVPMLRFAFATCQDWPSGSTRLTATWSARTWIWCSTWVTTPTSTRLTRRTGGAFPHLPDSSPRRSICTRIACAIRSTSSIPTCRRRTPASVRGRLGRSRGAERLLGPGARSSDRRRRHSPSAAPPRTRRTTSTCRFVRRWRGFRAGICASSGACGTAGLQSSGCSTTASTAATTRAATARPCAVRKQWTATTRCSAGRRSAGSNAASRSRAPAGTSSASNC